MKLTKEQERVVLEALLNDDVALEVLVLNQPGLFPFREALSDVVAAVRSYLRSKLETRSEAPSGPGVGPCRLPHRLAHELYERGLTICQSKQGVRGECGWYPIDDGAADPKEVAEIFTELEAALAPERAAWQCGTCGNWLAGNESFDEGCPVCTERRNTLELFKVELATRGVQLCYTIPGGFWEPADFEVIAEAVGAAQQGAQEVATAETLALAKIKAKGA